MQLRPLSASELLDLWESVYRQAPLHRALMLLHSACPDTSYDTLAQLSIGRRDHLLITLRGMAFGSHLSSVVDCPACGERTEISFDSTNFEAGLVDEPPEFMTLSTEGYHLRFRLPNSLDLAAVAALSDLSSARMMLAARCLLSVYEDETAGDSEVSQDVRFDQLPDVVVSALAEQMNAADPLAEIKLTMTCPACANNWQVLFDVVSYFWQEIDDWARRTLREIHALARNYGWREADILAMSAWRRRAYLEMVGP